MNAKQIGARLIELRGNKTQGKVAQDLGITPSSLSMYENGERIPRDEVKIKIAKYYDTTVEAIFYV